MQKGLGADRPVPASISIASTRAEVQHSAPLALPARATVTRTPAHTDQAPNNARGAREEAQRGSWGPGTLCPSAPFAKPRPPAESPRTAQSSHQCPMQQRPSGTLITPSQKRRNFPLHLAHLVLEHGLIRHHSTKQVPPAAARQHTAPAAPPLLLIPRTQAVAAMLTLCMGTTTHSGHARAPYAQLPGLNRRRQHSASGDECTPWAPSFLWCGATETLTDTWTLHVCSPPPEPADRAAGALEGWRLGTLAGTPACLAQSHDAVILTALLAPPLPILAHRVLAKAARLQGFAQAAAAVGVATAAALQAALLLPLRGARRGQQGAERVFVCAPACALLWGHAYTCGQPHVYLHADNCAGVRLSLPLTR